MEQRGHSGHGESISRERSQVRDRGSRSESILDDDSDVEFGAMEVEAERDTVEGGEVHRRRSTGSARDAQRQGRQERRAVNAVRIAAGLEDVSERGRDREAAEYAVAEFEGTFTDTASADTAASRDIDTYPHQSAEPSFSLFGDRDEHGGSDVESPRRSFRITRTRLDMDEDRDSAEIEGEEEEDVESRGRSSSSSGLSGLSSSRYAGSLIGDPRRRSGSSDRYRERMGGRGGSGSGDGANPFAAVRAERSYSLASTGSVSGSERARSSTSSFSDLGQGRDGDGDRDEYFPDGSGIQSSLDSRVRIVRSPIISEPSPLLWDDMQSSDVGVDGALGATEEGIGIVSQSSIGVDSLYASMNAPPPATSIDLK